LVSRQGRTLLLTGPPGAGKTTLTLSLCASGFAYGGDDIVHIRSDARAEGAAFAAAVKEGAWPLLKTQWPELEAAPIYVRYDGKRVRYLAPTDCAEPSPKRIDAVIVLQRCADGAPRLERIEAQDALCVLLASGYAERGSMDGDMLDALASDLSGAANARLTYSSAADAIACVELLLDA
jgi:hypothetical protein